MNHYKYIIDINLYLISTIVSFVLRDTVLVTVAAGGLGLAAVDLASNLFKAKVIIEYISNYVIELH